VQWNLLETVDSACELAADGGGSVSIVAEIGSGQNRGFKAVRRINGPQGRF
jgi:hypothetical protein